MRKEVAILVTAAALSAQVADHRREIRRYPLNLVAAPTAALRLLLLNL